MGKKLLRFFPPKVVLADTQESHLVDGMGRNADEATTEVGCAHIVAHDKLGMAKKQVASHDFETFLVEVDLHPSRHAMHNEGVSIAIVALGNEAVEVIGEQNSAFFRHCLPFSSGKITDYFANGTFCSQKAIKFGVLENHWRNIEH